MLTSFMLMKSHTKKKIEKGVFFYKNSKRSFQVLELRMSIKEVEASDDNGAGFINDIQNVLVTLKLLQQSRAFIKFWRKTGKKWNSGNK